ncbi:hypothetical protein DFH27DRAFT_543314 [Peziza echinospora]|nr:hypothetical protein DFH27DRAFT_543314 [Peziza echinospora]
MGRGGIEGGGRASGWRGGAGQRQPSSKWGSWMVGLCETHPSYPCLGGLAVLWPASTAMCFSLFSGSSFLLTNLCVFPSQGMHPAWTRGGRPAESQTARSRGSRLEAAGPGLIDPAAEGGGGPSPLRGPGGGWGPACLRGGMSTSMQCNCWLAGHPPLLPAPPSSSCDVYSPR